MSESESEAAGRSALRKASLRLLPLIGLGYGLAYMDRINISFAALQMNQDLGFSAAIYGVGGGVFFLSYALCEIPSNLLLVRFGARRWIARIMLTWGLLAAGMMFVRTPLEFYVMRFLLGAAEAGFFPGAVYYLAQWFPAEHRGRAISRFYVAFPLSTIVMGAVAGALLNLKGVLGLAGWQWLFLAEGLPAVLLAGVVLVTLPDRPADAPWLDPAEKRWLAARLPAQTAAGAAHIQGDGGVLAALRNPLVLLLGLVNLCFIGSSYAFTLSAPTILKGATGLGVTGVGYLVAAAGVVGAVTMIANGWLSDRRRERFVHTAVPLAVVAAAYLALARAGLPPGLVMLAYVAVVAGTTAMQGVFWAIPSSLLHGRAGAVGIAAINTIGMIGSFVSPMIWGVLRDRTGGYALGLTLLPIPVLAAAGIVLMLGRRARLVEGAAVVAGVD
ncbi:MAG: MFS transporter [Caulobacteraceae bacterium]|nr:MFS transporter [Caulobacteraceae bacterium]